MSTRPELAVQHAISGRIRLGIEALRGRSAEAAGLAEAVRALPGIRGARASAASASLVVEYDPAITLEDLQTKLGAVAALARRGIGEIDMACAPTCPVATDPRAPSRGAMAILEAAFRANSASHRAAGGHADLKLVIPGVLAGVGLTRLILGSGGPTPHWIVFFMYGFDAFAVLNQGMIRRFFGPVPIVAEG
jgi:hypothetical protein